MLKDDEKLTKLFAALPREETFPDFAQNVLLKARKRKSSPVTENRYAIRVLVTASMVVLILGIGFYVRESLETREASRQLAELRAEHRELTHDFANFRHELEKDRYMVLGSDEKAEYVIDPGMLRNIPTKNDVRAKPEQAKVKAVAPLLEALARDSQGGVI